MKFDSFDRFDIEAAGLQMLQSLEDATIAARRAEERLREAIEVLPEGIVFLDAEGRYILWNRKYAEIYAASADLLAPGAKLADTLRVGIARGDYPEACGREEEWLEHRLSLLEEPGIRHEQRLADGRCIMIEERKTQDGGTIGLRVDITELRQKQENFRLLFEGSPTPLLVVELETGVILSANEAACRFFDLAIRHIEGREAIDFFVAQERDAARAMLERDYSDPSRCWHLRRPCGAPIEAVVSTRLSELEGHAATIVSIFDLTERRRIEARMAHMARHDELTGLANRAHCREHLRGLLEPAGACARTTIALIDLDHFKAVNDTYGHQLGDTILKEAALRMRELIPANALLCRIGGDEFAVIFHKTSRTQVEIIAKSIISTLSQPFFAGTHRIHIGATVGFANAPYDSDDPETLMRYADLALYAAKGERRGTCRCFEPVMDAAAQEKTRLEANLREAVRKKQIAVWYQPIVGLESGEVEAYEALARWHHPVRGDVSPDVFIPLAEELGLIDLLGRHVLETACKEARGWPESIRLAVNVSPLQFRNGGIVNTVIDALSHADLAADRLELEITEAVLMDKGPRAASTIHTLRSLGIAISLDDFGTGYSSLGYLLDYPFTKIKIDKAFIVNLEHQPRSRAVISAVIGLGRNLGLTITAEGIESETVRDHLREEGCMQGQGYLFGKPLPPQRLAHVRIDRAA